jgi:hypothetical protein
MGCSVADTKTYYKKSGTSTRVAISTKVGIGANFNKDTFGLS